MLRNALHKILSSIGQLYHTARSNNIFMLAFTVYLLWRADYMLVWFMSLPQPSDVQASVVNTVIVSALAPALAELFKTLGKGISSLGQKSKPHQHQHENNQDH